VGCILAPLRGWAKNSIWKKHTPRQLPWAQAVGKQPKREQAPKERKKRVPHRWQSHPSPDLQTKDRQPLITPEIRMDLFAYLGGIIREMHGTALIINRTCDHVHMLIRIRPMQAAAEVARDVKSNSSRWVHEKWNARFAWQTGYGAFTVSESNVLTVSRYIAMQKEHHETVRFQEEYVAFLKKNKIDYDERYIWS
jgi:putative transposase